MRTQVALTISILWGGCLLSDSHHGLIRLDVYEARNRGREQEPCTVRWNVDADDWRMK